MCPPEKVRQWGEPNRTSPMEESEVLPHRFAVKVDHRGSDQNSDQDRADSQAVDDHGATPQNKC